MEKMIQAPMRPGLLSSPKPRLFLVIVLLTITAYYLYSAGPPPQLHIVTPSPSEPNNVQEDQSSAEKLLVNTAPAEDEGVQSFLDHEATDDASNSTSDSHEPAKPYWEVEISDIENWQDPDDDEDPNNIEPGSANDGQDRDYGAVSRLKEEKDKRKLWRYLYRMTSGLASSNQIYGKTIVSLQEKEQRAPDLAKKLKDDPKASFGFSLDQPVRFNPYPDYNSKEWKQKGYAPHVPCNGATGGPPEDLLVFKGRPSGFPKHLMGSYSALNLDPNLCWERDTRLGAYGLSEQANQASGKPAPLNWDDVNWGDLQRTCVKSNENRYIRDAPRENTYLSAYPETSMTQDEKANWKFQEQNGAFVPSSKKAGPPKIKGRAPAQIEYQKENRTAILLRAYTGKQYTENDKQAIRALITELSIKSGGEYEVFLLVHVKDASQGIFDSKDAYQDVLNEHIPAEFHGITVLWNDQVVWDIYTELKDENERSVHTAQWLSVQKFSHDHAQFEYIWNWEMDFRYTGHHYDLLDSIHKFARKQPRKGMWERNERWYIPEHHGDYDTDYRKGIEKAYGDEMVWGAPDLPFINPQGPKPPVELPSQDDYEWGVGEDADVITVGPMFNPVDSLWIISDHIWGYNDENHDSKDLPRRTTIVTQSRLSKRLLDVMHVENMRGNHVASEMTPQTVALLHGFKAVFAPHPVFMDRQWNGDFLNKWFNPGPKGTAGGSGSAMGWGRERRYQGNTWYYRAEPPGRLFNNWMGWRDTDIGGAEWEQQNGRPCLPAVMLHPIKNSEPTNDDHKTGFDLSYG